MDTLQDKHLWHCNELEEYLDYYNLSISDEEFNLLLKLFLCDKDVDWIMNVMINYKKSLTEALVAYITY